MTSPLIRPENCLLLAVDFQARLMPAIHDAEAVVAEARRLLTGAALLGVPILATEQKPASLGHSVPDLLPENTPVAEKSTFDAMRAPAVMARLADVQDVVVIGCEAHVCVLQTVAGVQMAGKRVFVVEDAVGSRKPASKAAALTRMRAFGAHTVTAEMVLFEWLGGADHPRFRAAIQLIK